MIVGQMLLDEAQEREWCSEYNEFVERVNHRLSTGWLVVMDCGDDDD